MKKVALVLVCVILFSAIFLFSGCYSAEYNEELLKNTTFSNNFESWTDESYKKEDAAFFQTADIFGEVRAVTISATDFNKAVLSQKVRVEKGQVYRITVQIKVNTNFEFETPHYVGAYLSVGELPFLNTDYRDSGSLLTQSDIWSNYTIYVRAVNVNYINVQLRCGGDGALVKGAASFTNISMIKIDDAELAKLPEWARIDDVSVAAAVSTGSVILVVGMLLIFIALCVFGNELIARAFTFAKENLNKIVFIGGLVVAFLLRFFLAGTTQGHISDMGLFRSWANSLAEDGIIYFYYNTNADYPPGYMYILYVVGNLINWLKPNEAFLRVFLKGTAIISDILASILIYKISQRITKNKTMPIVLSLLYAFNAAAIVNSAVWGQIDGLLALMLLLTLYLALTKKYALSFVAYTAALLFKFQAIFILPVYAAYFVVVFAKNPNLRLKLIGYLAACLAGFYLICLPFTFTQGPFYIVEKYLSGIDSYQYFTLNAFNLYGALNLNYADIKNNTLANVLNFAIIGIISVISVLLYFKYQGKRNIMVFLSGFIIYAVYMLSLKMHERYMFPAILLFFAAAFLLENSRIYFVACATSAIQFVNTVGLLVVKNFTYSINSAFMVTMSWLNVLLFVFTIRVAFEMCILDKKFDFKPLFKQKTISAV